MLTGAFTLAVLSIIYETALLHELAAFSVILLNGTGGGRIAME